MERPIVSVLSGEDLSQICAFADYTSLRWENKSAGAGDFEIHLPRCIKIPCGSVVKLSGNIREPYGVVIYVKLTETETVLIGKMLSKLFSWRYPLKDGDDLTYTSGEGVSKLICNAAKYGCTDSGNYLFGNPVTVLCNSGTGTVQYEGSLSESCLEAMSSIANDAKKTFKVTIESGSVTVWAGDYEDSGIILGSKCGGLKNPSFTYGIDNSRNLLAYSLKDGDGYVYQTYPALSKPTDTARRVLYIGRYDAVPGAEIRRKKNYFLETDSFEAEVLPGVRSLIAAGKKAKIEIPEWELSKEYNITSLTDIWEEKYSCRVVFGNSAPTAYEKIIQRF